MVVVQAGITRALGEGLGRIAISTGVLGAGEALVMGADGFTAAHRRLLKRI